MIKSTTIRYHFVRDGRVGSTTISHAKARAAFAINSMQS